jgi:hypothetical protein
MTFYKQTFPNNESHLPNNQVLNDSFENIHLELVGCLLSIDGEAKQAS